MDAMRIACGVAAASGLSRLRLGLLRSLACTLSLISVCESRRNAASRWPVAAEKNENQKHTRHICTHTLVTAHTHTSRNTDTHAQCYSIPAHATEQPTDTVQPTKPRANEHHALASAAAHSHSPPCGAAHARLTHPPGARDHPPTHAAPGGSPGYERHRILRIVRTPPPPQAARPVLPPLETFVRSPAYRQPGSTRRRSRPPP